MSSDDTAAVVLRSVAAVGLDAGPGDWPPQPLAEGEWRGVVQGAVREGVVGLLAAAVETGRLPASPQQHDDVRNAHTAALHTCLRLEDHLLAVTGILAAADVDVRVLKGPAVAHLDYEDPSQRTFVDIDLLVRSEEFDRAVRALVAGGGTRRYQEIRRGFDRRFGKGACVVSPARLETDLHRTFVMGPYGLWVDLDELWTAAEPFEVGGRELLALPADLRFLHACYHAALGDPTPRLSQLRDVAQMLIAANTAVDLPRLRSLARAWRGEAVVARAVSLTWDRLGLSDHALAAWAAGHRVSRLDARALATYLDPDMGFAARSMMAVQAVPSLRGKAAFVRALALPSRSYGAGRHRDRRGRWRAALGELRRLIGRRS